MKYVVGIDPGLQGALAVLDSESNVVRVEDTPSFLLDGKRREYDVPGMVRLFDKLLKGNPVHVFLERQQSRPEAGVASVFKIGYGFGLWMGLFAAWGIPHSVVSPQVWQREMYQGAVGEGKERSLLIASRLWPNLLIGRHDRADALLIAEYGRRTLGKGTAPRWEEVG